MQVPLAKTGTLKGVCEVIVLVRPRSGLKVPQLPEIYTSFVVRKFRVKKIENKLFKDKPKKHYIQQTLGLRNWS